MDYMTEFSPDNNSNVYQIKDKEAAPIDLLKDTVGWVGKNELHIPNSIVSQTINDVTITITRNANGEVAEVDFNGTASSAINFILYNGQNRTDAPFKNKSVILSKGDSALLANTGLYCNAYNGTTYKSQLAICQGIVATQSSPFVVDYNGYDGIRIGISADSGVVFNHTKFYPMLRDASIIDSTFEPYHESVEQTLRDAEVIEGVNLLDPQYLTLGIFTNANFDRDTSTVFASAMAYVKAGSYTISFDKNVNIVRKIKDGQYLQQGEANTRYSTITSTTDGWIGFSWRDSTSSSTNWDISSPVQIEKGYDTVSPYEPYYIPLKDKLTELATVQESAVTDIISGATVSEGQGGNHLYKKSGVVQMILGLEGVTVGAFSTFAKVPDGYKPIATMITNTFRTTGNQIYIAPNGNIQCASALNNANINIVATWVTS